jgi:hypothetical protein
VKGNTELKKMTAITTTKTVTDLKGLCLELAESGIVGWALVNTSGASYLKNF